MKVMDCIRKSLRCARDFFLYVTNCRNLKNTEHLKPGMVFTTYNDDVVRLVKAPIEGLFNELANIQSDQFSDPEGKRQAELKRNAIIEKHLCSNCYFYTRGCTRQCGDLFGKVYFQTLKERKFISRDLSVRS